jgi:hypothetical protein
VSTPAGAIVAEPAVETEADQFFVGSIMEPQQRRGSIGFIVIGLGIADVMAVRRFAALGHVAMQIRLIKDSTHHKDERRRHITYDETGVARCRRAMDLLSAKHGVERFILMGNCTLANICFNTARVDFRVAGLILTNPHVPETEMDGVLFKIQRHFFRKSSWARLLKGQMQLPGSTALSTNAAQAEKARVEAMRWDFKKDIVLPRDFDRKLASLVGERPLPALIVFSDSEASFVYFERHYRKTLNQLVRAGKLRYEVIQTDQHDFSARTETATALNDLISDWMKHAWGAQSLQR